MVQDGLMIVSGSTFEGSRKEDRGSVGVEKDRYWKIHSLTGDSSTTKSTIGII